MPFEKIYNTVGDFVKESVDSARNFFVGDFPLGVFEDMDKYRIEAILPGIAKERIAVTMDAGRLRVTVNPLKADEEKPEGYFRNQRNHETLVREAFLEKGLESEASARMEDGILYIVVPKTIKEDTSQHIDID